MISTARHSIMIAVLTALLICIGFSSLFIGAVDLPAKDILAGLFGYGDEKLVIIVQELRLPRVLLGILAGATLGLSGAALQGLLRNPLADPGVIGVSSSAGLGAVIAIYFGLSVQFPLAIQILAMTGALVATGILFILSSRDSSILTLILAGIGISSLATAAIALAMNYAPTPMSVQDMVLWLLGSLENRTYDDLILSMPFIVIGAGLLLMVGQGLDACSLGEDTARSLGINLERIRLLVIIGSAISVGATVAICGTISFVGLVVPHIMRYLVGPSPGKLLIPSALGGACILLIADLITRMPFGDGKLALGVVTSIIGAPLFLYIIFKTRDAMR